MLHFKYKAFYIRETASMNLRDQPNKQTNNSNIQMQIHAKPITNI